MWIFEKESWNDDFMGFLSIRLLQFIESMEIAYRLPPQLALALAGE